MAPELRERDAPTTLLANQGNFQEMRLSRLQRELELHSDGIYGHRRPLPETPHSQNVEEDEIHTVEEVGERTYNEIPSSVYANVHEDSSVDVDIPSTGGEIHGESHSDPEK